MGFKCGITGLPNVGKSTLFNALTKASVPAENYPFCTIEPNVGIVPVPDDRLKILAPLVHTQKIVPTMIEFVDIAGLVEGAAEGEGLGNQFLAHIRETEAIAHVVRCFENSNIIHVRGKISPLDDIAIINAELALADLDTVAKALARVSRKIHDKDARKSEAILRKAEQHLNQGFPVRSLPLEEEEKVELRPLFLLTAKPVLYIANVDEKGLVNNPMVDQVRELAQKEGSRVVIICAAIESELAVLPDDEKLVFLKEYGLEEPGLNRLIRTGYELLGLQTFFTAGPQEVHAWTVRKGALAPEAAGRIHSDFEKGFIRAEVISYADFIQYQGESGAKAAGKWRLEGKEYLVQDGDIMHFRFNV